MTDLKDNKIAEACGILFGENFAVEQSTIEYLQLSGIKHAFREKVKTCHPDTVGADDHEINDNFIKLKDAYDFLISVKSDNHHFKNSKTPPYQGPSIPHRKLRLGEYLYYTGKITWKELISAITWQRQNRNTHKKCLFGMYFVKFGILSSSELGFSIFKMNVHNSNY